MKNNLFFFPFFGQILEDIGVWDNVKRLAGTSAGAICAAMLAIGYDSHAIEEFLLNDLTPRRVFGRI